MISKSLVSHGTKRPKERKFQNKEWLGTIEFAKQQNDTFKETSDNKTWPLSSHGQREGPLQLSAKEKHFQAEKKKKKKTRDFLHKVCRTWLAEQARAGGFQPVRVLTDLSPPTPASVDATIPSML